jgi:periplasmic copper chaperone A
MCWLAAAALLGIALAHITAKADTPAQTLPIRIDDAWIRWLPAGVPGGGYLTMFNLGDRPVTLVAASSPDYGEISLHRNLNRGETVEMVPVAQVTVGPHSRVDFAAMGYHFMLMQPSKSREPGDHVPITLRFADGASLKVSFEVRR